MTHHFLKIFANQCAHIIPQLFSPTPSTSLPHTAKPPSLSSYIFPPTLSPLPFLFNRPQLPSITPSFRMTICKFYQSGRCRYGNNCKFEHIDPPGSNNSSNPPSSKSTDDHPQWPLSAIALPGNEQQGNSLTGDLSPEELRAMAYAQAPRGQSNDVTQRESRMVAEHQAKLDALSRGGMQTHAPTNSNAQSNDPFAHPATSPPQLSSFANSTSAPFGQAHAQPNPFGAPSAPAAFGQPHPFGQLPSANHPPLQQNMSAISLPPSMEKEMAPTVNGVPTTPAAVEQFTASQFGFSKVPETAPPPQFY